MDHPTQYNNRRYKTFFKKTKRGSVCKIDLLENAVIVDVVVLSVVLSAVLKRNKSVFTKLRQICSNPERRFYEFSNEFHKDTCIEERKGESSNDRNDRAIRVATQWYQKHLGSAARVLLITSDRENRRKAGEEGIATMTVESYVKSLGQQELLNLLKQPSSKIVETDDAKNLRPSKRQLIYREDEVSDGS